MDSSMKLQMDVKNNAQELRNYMLDLNNWEEEMRRKEMALNNEKPPKTVIPPPRNKIKRSKPDAEKNHVGKPKKISAYDYSAWDKFDVEKACAEIDEDDQSDNKNYEQEEDSDSEPKEDTKSDSLDKNKDLSLIDEAFYEKELGNNFVKKERWMDAIKCYSKAIELDARNAIYYANRSLCFLKLKNFKSAETDATTAIQLDGNYVKAYQRRAIARLALGQLVEAKSDYEQILKLEPQNKAAQTEISRIDERLNKEKKISTTVTKKTFEHKKIFKSEEKKSESNTPMVNKKENKTSKNIYSLNSQTPSKTPPKTNESKINKTEKIKEVDSCTEINSRNKIQSLEQGDGDKKVSPNSSEVTSRIFKPLPEWCKVVRPVHIPPHKRSKKPLRRIDITTIEKDESVDFAGDAKASVDSPCERKIEIVKPENEIECISENLSFEAPKTAVQFQNSWKIVKKNLDTCYSYLKKIQGRELAQIFENSLESDVFSELITFLASEKMLKDLEVVYDFLLGLSKVKRFSSLTMFMSESDKKCVRRCIGELEKVRSKEQISELVSAYELKI